MKVTKWAGAAVLMLMWGSASAQTCADIEFTGSISQDYPNIADFCQNVVVRDGAQFARLRARVVRAGFANVTLRLLGQDGNWGNSFTVTPGSSFRAVLDGQETRVRDLPAGQELNIYIREGDQWSMAITESNETDEVQIVQVVQPVAVARDPAPVAMPKTATLVPLAGALGLGFTVLGLAAGVIRRRRA